MQQYISYLLFFYNIKLILQNARSLLECGEKIVEVEQDGENRVKYGSNLINELSKQLTADFRKGFTPQNLRNIRQFYLNFLNRHTLCDQLNWSHYRLIKRIENEKAREYYIQESIASNWSVRALERQINSLLSVTDIITAFKK